MTSEWLERANRNAEETLLSIPREMLSPVGQTLRDRIVQERVETKTHLRLVK